MKRYLTRNRPKQRGNISLILILILLGSLVFYYFRTNSGENGLRSIDSGSEGSYLDQNIVALQTVMKIKSGEIALDENNTLEFKMNRYAVSLTRGSDFSADRGIYKTFLIETYKEDLPADVYQYLFVGIPIGDLYSYYPVHKQSKTM